MQNTIPTLNNSDIENGFNIKEEIAKYYGYWKWFIASVLVCVILAFLYLRYTAPSYSVSATILIKDENKGGGANELSAFSDKLGLMSGAKSNVDNEVEVLKARTLTYNAIKELKFNISYFIEGNVVTSEVYKDTPIHVNFVDLKEDSLKNDTVFKVKSISSSKYKLLDGEGHSIGEFSYGQEIKSKLGTMIVTYNFDSPYFDKNKDFDVIVKIMSFDKVAKLYKDKLSISTVNKQTSVITLSVTDLVSDKGVDFINTIISRYNDDAIEDKNMVARNTERFINQRLENLTKDLDDVETDIEGFKEKNELTDIKSNAILYTETANLYEGKVLEAETQLNVIGYMVDFLKTSGDESVIPANVIPNDNEAASLINEYNKLLLAKQRISVSATESNPQLLTFNNQLKGLRSSITKSLQNLKSSTQIERNKLQKQKVILGGKVSKIPGQEKEFREKERQQSVKQALYLYLLEKREENAIKLAVTAPSAKVIDAAYAGSVPVFPKKNIVLLGALLFGFLIPIAIIYLKNLLDTKIHNYIDIEKLGLPYLGDVPRSETKEDLVNLHSRSGTAEALRIVRTNLEFMVSQVPKGLAKTIFVTSTIPKEGKTFISVNLATTIALTGKKVLLLGMDIRNPKLDEYVTVPTKGLTNYLSSVDNDYNNYIVQYPGFEQFYIMPAGIIPPNPAELLMSHKLEELLTSLKSEYDYIVVDTAPVSLVTDTLIVANLADAFVYVSRAGYLDKRMLAVPNGLYKDNKLPNMAMVLNDTTSEKGYGYGYGFGYGYGAEVQKQSSWMDKIFRKK